MLQGLRLPEWPSGIKTLLKPAAHNRQEMPTHSGPDVPGRTGVSVGSKADRAIAPRPGNFSPSATWKNYL